uniref:Endosialin n=1 Tax=Geotrypetes seraphini TaxID=260995 RepID=A0A6P8S5H1_GEOSA|nr:endosialin [Geotrypetes seraphini]
MLVLSLFFASGLLMATQPQDLRETDALCDVEGCYAVYFQRRSFLDSWRSCRDRGGNLATVKRPEEAMLVEELLLGLGLMPEQGRLRFWIGLQRQPRQCPPNRPLRGFTWTTGDQDTLYTNWLKPEAVTGGTCPASRCVVIGFGTALETHQENFKWQDGSCSIPVDGFICKFQYKGMCPGIEVGPHGPITYTTPFNLVSTLLNYVPFGSVAAVPCLGSVTDVSVLCMQREDGSIGWSKEGPWCVEDQQDQHMSSWCDSSNDRCDHICVDGEFSYYCECEEDYLLMEDGHSCFNPCESNPCEFSCLVANQGYVCSCPEGYSLEDDGRSCQDVDECTQSTCDQLCLNFAGGYECQCHLGYQLEDGQCQDTDECADAPCEHACENTPGSYTCHCHLGFSPAEDDLHRCTDTDECQIRDVCQQMCVNYIGGFECYCNEGFEVATDGIHCRPVQEESPHHPATPDFLTPTDSAEWVSEEETATVENEDEMEKLPAPLRLTTVVTMPVEDESLAQLELIATQPEEEDGTQLVRLGPMIAALTTTEQAQVTTAADFTVTAGLPDSATWLPEASADSIFSKALLVTTMRYTSASVTPSAGRNPEARLTGLDIQSSHSTTPSQGHLVSGNEISHWFQGIAAGVRPTLTMEVSTSGDSDSNQQVLQRRDDRWLMVALLVPLCVFLVIMLALGIVYCTRCGAPSKRKSITDCYRWVTSTTSKTPAPKGSAKPTTCRTSV